MQNFNTSNDRKQPTIASALALGALGQIDRSIKILTKILDNPEFAADIAYVELANLEQHRGNLLDDHAVRHFAHEDRFGGAA